MDALEIKKQLDELHDSLNREFKEFRDENDKQTAKKVSDILAEAKIDKINEAIQKKDEQIAKLTGEVEGIKTAMNRPCQGDAAERKSDRRRRYAELMRKYMKAGVPEAQAFTEEEKQFLADERKSLSVDDDAHGGFLVHPEKETEMLRTITEFSPIRELADVKSIGSDALEIPRRTQGTAAVRAGEREARSETQQLLFGMMRHEAPEMYVYIPATQKMLDDSSFDVEGYINSEAAEAYAVKEAGEFLTGTGVDQARGILTYDAGTSDGQIQQVNTGNATLVTADGFVDVYYALKGAYARSAIWLMKRDTIKAARKLKDGNGAYIWLPGLQSGEAGTIMGRPYREAPEMDGEGAGNLVAVLADWKRAYYVVDRMGTRMLRDPYSSKPYIIFYLTRRVGGGAKVYEASKIMKCSA